MTSDRAAIRPGFHAAAPSLIVPAAEHAIASYARAFGARELFRSTDENGAIRHAEEQGR